MSGFVVFKTAHWVVSHRIDSRYSGYLIVSSTEQFDELAKVGPQALNELGNILSTVEKLLIFAYSPYKVIIAKLGFSKNLSCHFHALPITDTVLQEIIQHPKYTGEPDGKDAMLFISREYYENPLTST